MTQLLASKIAIEEEQPRIRNVEGVPTAVLGAVGIAERGPVGVETLITSFEEYSAIFGGYVAAGDLAQAMEGYFRNGGSEAHVVRTVHYSDVLDPNTKTSAAATINLQTTSAAAAAGYTESAAGPWALDHNLNLVVAFEAGGDQTFAITAVAASRQSADGTFNVTTGDGYNITVGAIGPLAWTIQAGEVAVAGAATATELRNSLNAFFASKGMAASAAVSGAKVVVTTNQKGSGAILNFVSAIVNGANIGMTTGLLNGTGNVANHAAVTAAEWATIAAAITNGTVTVVANKLRFTSATTGGSSTAQVKSASTADTLMGFDNAVHTGSSGAAVNTLQVDGKTDGTYAHKIKLKTSAATSGESGKFNFSVLVSGLVVEVFPNLSIGNDNVDALDYCETIINDPLNGSKLVKVTDLAAAVASPGNVPAAGTSAFMSGGNDGLAGLGDTDFTGASSDAGKTGIRALDTVQQLSILIVPGQATSAVQNAMITYAEVTRAKQMVSILDSPAATSAKNVITYFETTAALLGLSEHGIAYWPRIKVLNPNKSVFGSAAQITVPPSGHIAGVYARNDGAKEGGVYTPPAGTENGVILGCLDFDHPDCLEEEKRDLVFPKRINPLTVLPGSARHIDGARTLKGNGNFPTVGERRGAIFIEQSIKNGLQFARHQNNTEELRGTVDRTVTAFMLTQMNNGAFRSKDPATAFFVDFGAALNPAAVAFAGQMIGRIGLATVKPAEYIILRFSQDTRAFEEELAA